MDEDKKSIDDIVKSLCFEIFMYRRFILERKLFGEYEEWANEEIMKQKMGD